MRPLETVILSVGGGQLAHLSCSLTESAEDSTREARFGVAWAGSGLPCMPGDDATVTVSGELWGTGYIRDVQPSHDATRRNVNVTFVSRTVDALECSIDHPTGFAKDCDLVQIARTFDTLGIGIEGDVATEKKARHKVIPGETLFDTIEGDARAQGVLIHDTPQGRLKLADRPEGRHAGALSVGVNILSASASLTEAGRHSPVKVRGQNSTGTGASQLRPEAEAKDSGVRCPRPRIVAFEGEATSARLKKRAAWEARRGAGNGTSCSIVTPGWRDPAGRRWTRNFLVPVDDDWIGVKQDMVIASVTFDQDSAGGTTASLSLKDPRALGGENPRGASAAGWAAPEGEPTYRDEG